jgi:apolipoprotein N-acyltransferase
MYSQSKTNENFPLLLGYALTQFAIVAGAATFPSSNVWLALSFIEVGACFVVAIPVIVMVHLSFMCALFAGLRSLARRLIFGADRSQMTSKSSHLRKDLEPQGTNAGLWDRWIDGSL